MSEITNLVLNLLQLSWAGVTAAECSLVLLPGLERTEVSRGRSRVSGEVLHTEDNKVRRVAVQRGVTYILGGVDTSFSTDMNTFPGLMSRWTSCLLWMYWRPFAT